MRKDAQAGQAGKLIFVLLDEKTGHLAHCGDRLAPVSSQL